MNLSTNLTLEECTTSQTALRRGIDNQPAPDVLARLTVLADTLFEPARALLGVPLHINSGYRSAALNKAVGGAPTSAHLRGEAIDFVPIGMDKLAAFDTLRASNIPYDQIIEECGANGWIHFAIARVGAMPRRQALRATGGPGKWVYVPVMDPA